MPIGPCEICGDINYPLSMGGPNICPPCDCGISPKVRKLETKLKIAEEKIQSLEAEVKRLKETSPCIYNHLDEIYELQASLSLAVGALKKIEKHECLKGCKISYDDCGCDQTIASEALCTESIQKEIKVREGMERVIEASKLDLQDEDSCLETHKLCEHMVRTREALKNKDLEGLRT